MQIAEYGKPRLLDTFCGAGGCTKGYQMAGFYVVGVDNRPQPHYCGDEFIQADAIEFIRKHGREYDAIHASPPCQGYSRMRHLPWLVGREYPLLIEETRTALQETNRPFVIENVADSPLNGGLLCGTSLGLNFSRHRRFESNVLLMFPPCPGHDIAFAGRSQMSQKGRKGGVMGFGEGVNPREAMGVVWMNLREARQAIPPVYTEWIGRYLIEYLAV